MRHGMRAVPVMPVAVTAVSVSATTELSLPSCPSKARCQSPVFVVIKETAMFPNFVIVVIVPIKCQEHISQGTAQ
eukprot:1160572-Ditylum_brightwellii.AAC.1